MTHTPRTSLFSLFAACALLVACDFGSPAPEGSRPFVVRARPMTSPLADRPEGPLRFLSGFELSTRHLPFGGFSGLVVEKDRLLAVSDWGFVWQARPLFDSEGVLLGFSDSHLGPLHNVQGVAATRNNRYDSEEITPWDHGWLVSFEGDHSVLHYRARTPFALSDQAPTALHLPEEIKGLQLNGGIEAMTRLSDGRLLLIAEMAHEDEESPDSPLPVWLGDPRIGEPSTPTSWQRLTLERTGAFHPTSATVLPTNEVLLLERSWNKEDGVRIRLSTIAPDQFVDGAHISPREIWRFEDPETIDNFEAMFVTGSGDRPVHIYLLTDDNFSDTQKTLLMQLELVEAP